MNDSAEKRYTIAAEHNRGKSTYEFEVEITADALKKKYEKNLAELTARAELQGFRKGKAPQTMVEREYGQMSILQNAAQELSEEIVPLILAEKKLNVIAYPRITITAIAMGNPLKFTLRAETMPDITLPDYKKIALAKNAKRATVEAVSEKELTEAIERIRTMAAKQAQTPDKLPEITDEFVKKLGNFDSVETFKSKLKDDLQKNKERTARERHRLDIAEEIIRDMKAELPDSLIEYELSRMESGFREDLQNVGITFEDYLKKTGKKIEELQKEWRPDAEKRAKMEILISKIASAEHLAPNPSDVEHETAHILEHYKDADKNNARLYVERMLTSQLVFDFLEAGGKTKTQEEAENKKTA